MNQNNPQNNLTELLPVLKYGNPILREKVYPIKDFTGVSKMVKQMFNTMINENGIGLAGNQVGFKYNIMVLDTRNYEIDQDGETYIFINSEIIQAEGESIMEEGCLSIPDIRAQIKRPEHIMLKYQDIDQNFHERHFSGLISRVIQHEMDHLNGKLFIDYLPLIKKTLINKRLLEISKQGIPSTGIIL